VLVPPLVLPPMLVGGGPPFTISGHGGSGTTRGVGLPTLLGIPTVTGGMSTLSEMTKLDCPDVAL
jgi:hypothetical protein